jgi:hypothetical protein
MSCLIAKPRSATLKKKKKKGSHTLNNFLPMHGPTHTQFSPSSPGPSISSAPLLRPDLVPSLPLRSLSPASASSSHPLRPPTIINPSSPLSPTVLWSPSIIASSPLSSFSAQSTVRPPLSATYSSTSLDHTRSQPMIAHVLRHTGSLPAVAPFVTPH